MLLHETAHISPAATIGGTCSHAAGRGAGAASGRVVDPAANRPRTGDRLRRLGGGRDGPARPYAASLARMSELRSARQAKLGATHGKTQGEALALVQLQAAGVTPGRCHDRGASRFSS